MPYSSKTMANSAAVTQPYVPKWSVEERCWQAYASKDGKGYEEARRHRRALDSAIKRYVRDPANCQKLLGANLAKDAKSLAYMNPFARLIWGTAVVSAFRACKPKGRLFAATLIGDAFTFSTVDEADAVITVLKRFLEAAFEYCGADVFGNIEFAVFPKTKKGDGYRISAHFQGLVWGVRKQELKNLLPLLFPALEDGTPGSWVEQVRTRVWHVISYNLKPPAYGYQGWPRADGPTQHIAMSIPRKGHWQLLQQFAGVRWPDLAIAVGEGKKILRHALRKMGTLPESPLTDFAIPSAESSPASAAALTLEVGINPALGFEPSDKPLEQCAGETTAAFDKYLQQRRITRSDLYEFLQRTYGLAMECAGREAELKELVQAKGLMFNRASDLIALSLKCVIPKENYNKKRASEWAQALRYLYMRGYQPTEISERLAEFGITKCARAAMDIERTGDDGGSEQEEPWHVIDKYGRGFEVATNQLDMPFPKGILIAEGNEDKNRLVVRHVLDTDDPIARSILKKLAQRLQKTHPWAKLK